MSITLKSLILTYMDTEHVIEFNVHSNIHLKRKILANEPLKDVSS